jgi:DNA-binding GntR family transcriptional regulator
MVQGTLARGVRERVVNQLREDILSRRLAEGERLSEMELARRFGVSRGTIREALVQLTHEGLLVAQPNRGVRVATSAPNSIRKLVTPIRRTIETYALDSIFDDLGEDDFRVLEGILERMKLACERGDFPATIEPDIAFHRFLLERAGQPDLVVIWSTIIARIRRHLEQVHRDHTFTPLDVYNRHHDLVRVFRAGDKDAAVKALQEHIV